MSMPPPPHSPGPYGPSQQPSPYGGQQYPPHPQQQGYPGPGYPGQPYPPQPYHGQAGWGQPPMGPPPGSGSRTGRTIGIVAATVAGLIVAGFVVRGVNEAGARAGGVGFPEARYRHTVPNTLLDGTYRLSEESSQTKGKDVLKDSYDSKVRNPKPATARYTSGSPKEPGVLALSGMYGQFKDPAGSRRKMMAGAAKADGVTVAVSPKEITPAGSDVTLTCQVLTSVRGGATSTLPMCAWADENTSASVAVVTAEIAEQDPASVDLEQLARTTVKVRAEARQPIN
ncbi:hypothetical protein ACIA98_12885 [Streptomyces sp. NPDC051366]|uniref:hypothetical protein n=1 Tax=Streptomyces sp. NPDC051366 TaxID=3365652 RepID=UPI0037891058